MNPKFYPQAPSSEMASFISEFGLCTRKDGLAAFWEPKDQSVDADSSDDE